MRAAGSISRITRAESLRDSGLLHAVVFGLCAQLVGLTACRGERAPAPNRAQSVRAAAPAVAVGGPVSAPDAFELIATSDGAVLVWAGPGVCAHGLSLQRLTVDGQAQAPATSVSVCAGGVPAQISELTAAAGGGRLGLAWIEDAPEQSHVLGTHAADGAQTFAPPQQLGAAEPSAQRPRSRLSLVASETGAMRIAWQAPRERCVGEPGTCSQLVSQPHPPLLDAANRRSDVREVPGPCARLLVGSLWTAGIWYDAFCALDATGQHATTQVYAIRPEIFYAEADPALSDCEPLGLAPTHAGAVAWGRCDDGLRAHTLAPEGKRQVLRPAARTATCEAGRPLLEATGSGAREQLGLDAPRDRLELWLPQELAPAGARAVFTGRRLLVASVSGQRLSVRALRCDGHRLVSEPAPML